MFVLRVPRPVLDRVLAHARREHPHECCGLLAGVAGIVTADYPLRNAAGSGTEFVSDAADMFAAVKAVRAAGTEILAVYHSHPSSAPVPSRRDVDRNYSPDVVNLIVGPGAEVRGWWLSAAGYREAEWEIVPADLVS